MTATRLLSRRPQTSVPDLGLLPTSLTTRTRSPLPKLHQRERIAAATLTLMLHKSKHQRRVSQLRSKLSVTRMTHQTVRSQLLRKLPQRRLMLTLKPTPQVLKKANANYLSNLCLSKLTRVLFTTTSHSSER